ncbi:phosphotransferase family protein [Apiospora arundinis]|uniref:Phosphotransferase family protein n=1 Tax=Apiospora arundinis TaxID=335852 RepID=A0ABR2IHQ2_9PEZI
MAPKPRCACMDKDDMIWEKLDEEVVEWDKAMNKKETYLEIAELLQQSCPVPEEKIRYEVATMRYVAANTTIPIPHIYHYGTAAENPTGLGPFIIMDYIDHHQNMSRELLHPSRLDERSILDPNIDEKKLELMYAQMANILLQLSNLSFPRGGSLVMDKDGSSPASVGGRPLIANMAHMVVHTNAPVSILPPARTYDSSNEWYRDLADMHMAQLVLQHNDAVDDEDDARDKYVARQMFRNIAAENRVLPGPSSPPDNEFRLFSEDLRPANVLLDEDLRVVGVIDWEFAYAAPAQFSYDPPWWLLLREPEEWLEGNPRLWLKAYEPRLQVFLRALEGEEKKMMATGDPAHGLTNPPLSWAFDFIWWKFLDESYFGPNDDQDHSVRLQLLSKPQREMMEPFVARKMQENTDRRIVKWEPKEAASCLAEVLV